jgi:hypothetical protein
MRSTLALSNSTELVEPDSRLVAALDKATCALASVGVTAAASLLPRAFAGVTAGPVAVLATGRP